MELFVKVKQVFATRSGVSQTTGNAWSITPVLFEELNSDRPQSMVLDVFGSNEGEGALKVGMFGKVRFGVFTQLSRDGQIYNRLKYYSFNPTTAENA